MLVPGWREKRRRKRICLRCKHVQKKAICSRKVSPDSYCRVELPTLNSALPGVILQHLELEQRSVVHQPRDKALRAAAA